MVVVEFLIGKNYCPQKADVNFFSGTSFNHMGLMAKYFSWKSFLALKDNGKTLPQESISL